MKKDIFYSDYAKQLTGEYKKAYDQIAFYVDVMNPANGSLPEIMNEVIDLLLSAQHDQRNIKTVIGDDRLQFCEDLVDSQKTSFLCRILLFLRGYRILAGLSFFVTLLSIYIDYTDGIANPWMEEIEIGGFIFIILFSCILFFLFSFIRRFLVRHTTWYTKSIDSFVLLLLFAIVIFFSFSQAAYFDSIVSFPKWSVSLLSLLVFCVCTWDKKKEKNKDIQHGNYISYDMVAYNANLEQLQKQYRKYEKKCTKKQQPIDDVNLWYEQHYHKDQRKEVIGKSLFVCIAIAPVIYVFMTSAFFDACIFLIMMGIFYYFYYRFLNKSILAKQAIYIDIKEKQTTIFDEELKKEDLPF